MSGPEAFPPPGSPPPPQYPSYPTYPTHPTQPPGFPPGFQPGHPPGFLPAHKPGAIALRPLTLGDLYDGAFKTIRANPGATVGSAALVSAVATAVPIALIALLSAVFDLGAWTGGELTEVEVLEQVGALGTTLLSALLSSLGLIFVTGMVAHVAMAAVVGQRLTLAQAWQATRGNRWRLVGLSALLSLATFVLGAAYLAAWFAVVLTGEVAPIVIWGVVTVPLFLCLIVWLYIRVYYLAVPPLMVEKPGIFGAIGRGYALTRGQFWRTLGIALLTSIVTGVASSVLSVPVAIVAAIMPLLVEGPSGIFLMLVLQGVGTTLATAFVAPFTACVVSLQYVDQRMRKEAYDVELLTRAGLAPA